MDCMPLFCIYLSRGGEGGLKYFTSAEIPLIRSRDIWSYGKFLAVPNWKGVVYSKIHWIQTPPSGDSLDSVGCYMNSV